MPVSTQVSYRRGNDKKHRRGVLHTPLRSSPQCYRSRVGMLTIICVDTYVCRPLQKLNCGQ